MSKLIRVAFFCFLTLAFWQCKEDLVWERPAIGTLSSLDLKFTSAGGSGSVRFNTTVGWSVSVKYAEGASATSWCHVSPASGGAGESEITIQADANDSYDTEVAEVIVNAGGATKTYKVVLSNKNELIAAEYDFTDLPFTEQVIAIPLSRTVEYSIDITPETAKEWITLVESKAAPVKDTIRFKIATYQSGLALREATISLRNDMIGVTEQIAVSQQPGPTLVVSPLNHALDGKAQVLDLSVLCSMNWALTQDEPTDWCRFTTATTGERGEHALQLSVDAAVTKGRTATFTVTADTMIRIITVKQTESGVTNGAFIYKGAMANYSAPSLVESGNALYAFYTYPYALHADKMFVCLINEQGSTPTQYNIKEGRVSVRVKLDAPANSMKQSCADGWSGAQVLFELYRWDTDYETTVAAAPIRSNGVSKPANTHVQFLESNDVIWPGEYLVVLTSDKPGEDNKLWSWSVINSKYAVEAWHGETLTTTGIPEFYWEYDKKSNGLSRAAYRKSTDKGVTWSDQTLMPSLNKAWSEATAFVSPANFNVTKGSGYYYALFGRNDVQGVCVARSASVDGDWMSWDGSGWSADGATKICTSSTPVSLVEAQGKFYIYYLDGKDVKVATASAGENWPAAISAATVAFTFPEESPAAIDVKCHASGTRFVATYVNSERAIGTLTSTDGTTFADAGALSPLTTYYLWAGASGVRYAVGENGAVNASTYISYARTSGEQGMYAFPVR